MTTQLLKGDASAKKAAKSCALGIIGLGVMGRNFLLNLADHGFKVAGFDKDLSKVKALREEGENKEVFGAENLQEFLGLLQEPRAVLLLIPAGPPVDSVIKELTPLLSKGDIIIDAGNSYYKDTDIRARNLALKGIYFLGVGVSGGEEGARHGPSIMPGGPKDAYERVKPLFEAASAHVNGDPCVAYLGKGSAGHFVKMVHNGIEYGIMQLIAESYDLMKRGLGLSDDELHDVFKKWSKSELNSYLIEITENIFSQKDSVTGKSLVDYILDVAKQLGTGMWTSQSGMELQVPIPIIDIAVSMRNLSSLSDQRKKANELIRHNIPRFSGNGVEKEKFLSYLQDGLYLAMILTYAQGMALLAEAVKKLNYTYNLEVVAKIWRGGCIIRSALLEDIRKAFQKNPTLQNLILDPDLSKIIVAKEEALRHVVKAAAELSIPAPAFMAALGYLDSYRSGWLPVNLIQAQRDYFGSHSYERNDEKGTYHTEWKQING